MSNTTGGIINGYGTVSAAITGSGGAVTANGPALGGTLNLSGSVATGQSFTIGTTNPSTLEFSGVATLAGPISISNSNQTLEVASPGSLTITTGAESITNGTIQMAGGTLTDR